MFPQNNELDPKELDPCELDPLKIDRPAVGRPSTRNKIAHSDLPQNDPAHAEVITAVVVLPKENQALEEKTKGRAQTKPKSDGSLVWDAYASSYLQRYTVGPVRNAKQNALCSQLAERLGSDAPAVAAYYVLHNGAFYVGSNHSLGLLIRDAEKIHVDWARGAQKTSIEARHTERRQEGDQQVDRVLLALKAQGFDV